MRRLVLSFVLMAAFAATAQVRIVAFGDSITQGKIGIDPSQNWLRILQRELGDGVVTFNAGVGGNSAREAMARFETDVLARRPDVLLVEFGGNNHDPWNSARRVDDAEFVRHLETLRSRLPAGCRAFAVTFPPVVDDWHAYGHHELFPDGLDAAMDGQREILRRFARESGWPVIDLYAILKDRRREVVLRDGVHLNPAGQRAFADAVRAALEAAGIVRAELRLGAPFADHAVLQRGMRVPVWGTAAPGDTVTVSFAEQEKTAVADASGAWRVTLDPLAASKEPRDLIVKTHANGAAGVRALPNQTIKQSNNQTILHDILVGEVWLCSGQSNMAIQFWGESPRGRDRLGGTLGQIVDRPLVRTATLRNGWSETPKADERVSWERMTPKYLTTASSSAVANYYGMLLHDALDVPVGILVGCVGGTAIETWIPGTAETMTTREIRKGPEQQPSRYFNGKIAPILPYALKGVVWYQGEGNTTTNGIAIYRRQMHELYDTWSKGFENPGMSFRFAQLAPWGNPLVPAMQEEQAKFAAEEPNAKMAVICDVGNLADIHPNDKLTVALRLVLLSLKYDYGRDIVADSPVLKGWKVEDGKFVMAFDHVRQFDLYDPDWSYHVDDAKTAALGFEVAGADGVWRPARIGNLRRLKNVPYKEFRGQIDGTELVVWSDEVKEPKRLRYLHSRPWRGYLTNEVGLPVGAFHIDAE